MSRSLKKLLGLLLTLLSISLVVFIIMNVIPGDPAITILGIESTPEARAVLRDKLGLNDPAWQRYVNWLLGAFHGDFGVSYSFGVPVSELVAERLPLTLTLALVATVLTIVGALALGAIAAMNHGNWIDRLLSMTSQIGVAVPVFWLAMILVIVFAVQLRWVPPGGFPGWSHPVAGAKALILPACSLALVQTAILARVTRAAILEVARLDYVRTARSMGLNRRQIMLYHILPNAMVPIVTVAGLQFASLITGTIVIENVFYLPGLGRLMIQSIGNRDLITVQALVVLFAVMVVLTNFVVDVFYAWIDPRMKEGRT
ncbi:Dipeptide transport system permease protein DppB [Candidatus Rhodobacter oscarellae]|uniref:Dipeptide transport system permease protein DppB n=2 Tax=Candidatus Rhodobacter oscarellae TaxID=1675527 RepID=A0A0J9E9T9_9RHOB|nr:Dipeptide transport system permease protein DppB [Candidatus Rhodobacter lobularis]